MIDKLGWDRQVNRKLDYYPIRIYIKTVKTIKHTKDGQNFYNKAPLRGEDDISSKKYSCLL